MDEALWFDAGRLKVAHSLSVAGTFAVALARRLDADLLTTDHHEMDAVSATVECRIRSIR
ncbi:MAG: type II toxin-antitoxin system VapC family toxin [Armatimonadetes bacterium]|nr:type II toxin-antitoxin system VapC family toxin [Armatimonadota bacterium]